MKNYLHVFAFLLAGAALAAGSCTGDFEEYNADGEHQPLGNVDPCTLLEPILSTGSYYISERSWRVHNELMQYTVDCGSSTRIHRYIFQASEYKTLWDRYNRFAANADHMIRLAEKFEQPNAQAIGMTLKAVYVSLLTDLYGDIPYTEAYRIDEGITQPVFDPQQTVYAALIDLLQQANALYDASAEPLTVPAKDLMYGGDIARWRKFTNSLLMRLCMRLSNRPEMETAQLMQRMLDDPATYPLFGSWQDDAKIAYTGVSPFLNPFGDMAASNFTTSSRKCSAPFIDLLAATSDPRLGRWVVNPNANDTYYGVVGGVVDPVGGGACYMNVSVLKQYTTPVWLMTCSELNFILAEAAHRGMIGGGEAAARDYYRKAIAESIHQWDPGVSQANIDKFIDGSAGRVDYNGTLERIIEQKWVSLFFQGFESWCDYRRTGLPALPIGPDCENDGEMPSRMLYPQTVVSTNNTRYAEQVARMRAAYPVVGTTQAGGDNMLTPVWWSRKAVELEGAALN